MKNRVTRNIVSTVAALALVAIAGITLGAQAPQQTPPPKPSPAPSPATTITGKWTMSLEIPMGTATVALEFAQQGEKVTGTYEGRYGKWPLAGVLKNRVLDFAVTMSAEGTETTLSFRGEVSEDFKMILKGQADLGGMGEGTWLARRAEK